MISRTLLLQCLISLLFPKPTFAFTICPLLGPDWPAPRSIPSSKIVQAALKNLTDELDLGMRTGETDNGPVYPNTTTLSIVIFTSDDVTNSSQSPFIWDYHHTAPSVQNPVNSDSIYRIGDLSQVLTVLTFLVEAGDCHWDEPVTNYVPELKKAALGLPASSDPTSYVDWEDVRLGELATHLAGIGRDSIGSDVATKDMPFSNYGFPQLNETAKTSCGSNSSCSRADFFSDFAHRAPVFLPSSTPIYSNAAFQVLGYVLESLSGGKSFGEILKTKVAEPLGMSSTTLNTPNARSVIPGNASTNGWSSQVGDAAPAIGLYSTVSDLSRLGRSILSSSLLAPSQTRRWLKPFSATSNVVNSVGMPFEIYNSATNITDHVIDVYTKLGYSGVYSSYLGIVPSYDIGFAILAAGNDEAPDLNAYADIIGTNILPAIIETAATQAGEAFMGTYKAIGNGAGNSSLTIEINSDPGISVSKLSSRGADTRAAYAKILGIEADALSIRLFPTNLKTEAKNGQPGRWAFRAVFQDKNELEDAGTPTCISWMSIDSPTYGGVALDEFVFLVDGDGSAVGIEVPALQLKLQRGQ